MVAGFLEGLPGTATGGGGGGEKRLRVLLRRSAGMFSCFGFRYLNTTTFLNRKLTVTSRVRKGRS